MTALPPAGHLRDELARALPSSVGPAALRTRDENLALGEPFAITKLGDIVLDALLPAVARALIEARANELEQATADWRAGRFVPGVGSGVPSFDAGIVAARNELRVRATSLRASIRQTDERNDR